MDITTHRPPAADSAMLPPRVESAVRVAKQVAARESRADADPSVDAAQRLNDALVRQAAPELPASLRAKLELDIDPATRLVIGRIIDKETGELIKQIPAEEILRLIASAEKAVGVVVDRSL